jgi:HEAT repeat protein
VVAETAAAPELSAEWWDNGAEEDPFETSFEEPAPSVEESPAEWSRTSVARMCDGASGELQAMIRQLDATASADRKEALASLAHRGAAAEAALPAIAALLSDPDVLVQAHAAWSIWEVSHNPEASIDPLMVLLVEDHNPEIVQISAYLLGAIGPDAAIAEDALWYTCNHTTGVTRLHAAEALSRIDLDDARPVEILIGGLSDSEVETRWLAALALSSTAAEHRIKVIGALTKALTDPAPEVCAAAALSLGGFGDQASGAAEQLNAAASSDNDDVRTSARMALDCIIQ